MERIAYPKIKTARAFIPINRSKITRSTPSEIHASKTIRARPVLEDSPLKERKWKRDTIKKPKTRAISRVSP